MKSYSRDFQDVFVINFLRHLTCGTYLEIGGNHFQEGNNTYLLETDYDWTGVSLELDTKWKEEWEKNRKNPCLYQNAITANYKEILKDFPTIIDYLQLDCDPPSVTYEILKKIPFDKYKFRMITFEHDVYNCKKQSAEWQIKAKSRAFLESKGYTLLADNISAKGFSEKPFEDWWVKRELIDEVQFRRWKQVDGKNKECEEYVTSKINKRKIIFENSLAIGDVMVMTCGIRDFKLLFPEIQIDVRTNFDFLFNNNPYITHLDPNDKDVEYYKVLDPNTNKTHIGWMSYSFVFLLDMISQVDLHERLPITIGEFTSALNKGMIGRRLHEDEKFNKDFRLSTGFVKDFLIKNKDNFKRNYNRFEELHTKGLKQSPDIHLSPEQKNREEFLKKHSLPEKYWIVAAGGKHDCTAKIYDWERFQEVVDYFEDKITFVQIGQTKDPLQYNVILNGVINKIDKFKITELLPLVYHSQGCISQVSFLLHAAGAFNKPCVAIYGGREESNFASYEGHYKLSTMGMLDCCKEKGCWKYLIEDCENVVEVDGRKVQKCMSIITPQDIIRGIEMYQEHSINKSIR